MGGMRGGQGRGATADGVPADNLLGRKPTPSQHHSSNDRINVTSVTPNTTDSSQGTRSPTPLLKRGDLRHRLTRKLFDTPNANLTREVQELKGVVTTLQKKLEAVAPTISTNQTHLDPSDLRLRLTSRSGYGRSHKSETDPSYQPRHVDRSESYLRREKSIEDSTNSPPAASDKIRGRRSTGQKHCPQGRVHPPGRKVRPQGRTSRKPTSGTCPEEYTPPRDDSGYPLSKGIEKAKLPPNFRMPQCDLYDGNGDPGEHVYQFQTNMLLLQVSDAVMCWAFPTTLGKAAHAWFKSLRPRSIHSFAQLSDSFQKHFVSSRTRRKNSASLLNVVQERNESLSRYLGRFNAATLEIDNLDESVKYTAFMRGLRPTTKFAFADIYHRQSPSAGPFSGQHNHREAAGASTQEEKKEEETAPPPPEPALDGATQPPLATDWNVIAALRSRSAPLRRAAVPVSTVGTVTSDSVGVIATIAGVASPSHRRPFVQNYANSGAARDRRTSTNRRPHPAVYFLDITPDGLGLLRTNSA
ncbi:hypothetical protein RJ639_004598 [Escallonia herrerae]|uniref:Retrotransposon gag domain-containing protein n=1 Tax=Escallonia herrerae TaxID=1293975 RepID=A0AA88W1H9_9ASTE|nr:hypothetical protein RJ639_004598 [Escallonia herrerae]